MFCCNFQIVVTHSKPCTACSVHTNGPMVTEKHDKHMSETFMLIAKSSPRGPLHWHTPLFYQSIYLLISFCFYVCSFAIFYYFLTLLVELFRWWGLDDDQLHSSNDYFCNDYDYTELSFAPNWQSLTTWFFLVILEDLCTTIFTTHWFCYVYLIFKF